MIDGIPTPKPTPIAILSLCESLENPVSASVPVVEAEVGCAAVAAGPVALVQSASARKLMEIWI